jgi:type II secretion system protein C
LVEIYSDYVVLQKDGRTARLYLSGRPVFGGSGDATLLVVGGASKPMTPARITSREALTDYVRPSPVYDGDSLLGYQVYCGAKAGPFTQLGLQPGDLITTIGGTPLNEVSAAWEVLRTLMDGAVLEAIVKRHGETVGITLDGSILTRAEEARVLNTGLPMMTSILPGTPGQ